MNVYKIISIVLLTSVIIIQSYGSSLDTPQYIDTIKDRDLSSIVKHARNLNGINENYLIKNNEKQYIVSEIKNNLIDFKAYVDNYNAISSVIPISKLVQVNYDQKFLIREYIPGEILRIDSDEIIVSKIAEMVHALHNSSIKFDNKVNARNHISNMISHNIKFKNHEYEKELGDIVERIYSAMECMHVDLKPCHNDLNAKNFIVSDNNVYLIDWEFSSLNDPAWDLAYFMTISLLPQESINIFLNKYMSLGNIDSDFLDRITAYQPITLIFLSMYLEYSESGDKKFIEILKTQSKELYNSTRVQESIKRLENKVIPSTTVSVL